MNYEPKPSSALGYFSGRLCGGNSPPVAAGDLLPWPRAVYSQKHHYPWEVRICTSPGRVLQVAFFKTWQLRFGVFLGCAGAGLGSPALGRPEEQAENRALENRHFPTPSGFAIACRSKLPLRCFSSYRFDKIRRDSPQTAQSAILELPGVTSLPRNDPVNPLDLGMVALFSGCYFVAIPPVS